jgi:hypothetical protein
MVLLYQCDHSYGPRQKQLAVHPDISLVVKDDYTIWDDQDDQVATVDIVGTRRNAY